MSDMRTLLHRHTEFSESHVVHIMDKDGQVRSKTQLPVCHTLKDQCTWNQFLYELTRAQGFVREIAPPVHIQHWTLKLLLEWNSFVHVYHLLLLYTIVLCKVITTYCTYLTVLCTFIISYCSYLTVLCTVITCYCASYCFSYDLRFHNEFQLAWSDSVYSVLCFDDLIYEIRLIYNGFLIFHSQFVQVY